MSCRRVVAAPAVVAKPSGVHIRTRLRPSVDDETVLRQVGQHLSRLAGHDLADRCRLGTGDAEWTRRSRELRGASSSRWAGTITRASNAQWQRAYRNLLDERTSLLRATRRIRARLAAPVGGRSGRTRGYASQAERWAKQQRLNVLMARLAKVDSRITLGRVSVVRGGRPLLHRRHHLDAADQSEGQWHVRWQAARWFLTANGDATYALGNGTIMVDPDEGWLELKLPASLANLANRPRGRYRLSCSVQFSYRADQWRAQVGSGAVWYRIFYNPDRGRWYLDASWTQPRQPVPTLAELAGFLRAAVDLNAGHLACWVLDSTGNPLGHPITIPLDLEGACASTRDGRLRAAVSQLIQLARAHGCRALAVENLDFADARAEGRETLGRGKGGRRFRRTIAGLPTRRFRDRLVQMCSNQGLWVIAVDPAYTSKWGRQHWLLPLSSTRTATAVTVHHAAAVVIGRRSLGYRARRRPGVSPAHQRMGVGESCRPGHAPDQARAGPGPPVRRTGSLSGGARPAMATGPGPGPGGPTPFGAARQRPPSGLTNQEQY